MLRMHVAGELLSRIFQIFKILEIVKIIDKRCYFQKIEKFSEFQKIGIYVKELCQMYTCTKFQAAILKNDRALAF